MGKLLGSKDIAKRYRIESLTKVLGVNRFLWISCRSEVQTLLSRTGHIWYITIAMLQTIYVYRKRFQQLRK